MKLGLLNAYNYECAKSGYQAEYAPMFKAFLHEAMPEIEVKVYEVPELKNLPDPAECDAWIIGGSGKGAYDRDEWIARLEKWVRAAHQKKTKLVGVCFGHQLIAQALGGQVRQSAKGWGVGVHQFEVLSSPSWMSPPQEKVRLLFSHQDQVEELPKEAKRLATNDFCLNQMFTVGDNILCMQGHPEFSVKFMRDRLNARKEQYAVETYRQAIDSLGQKTDYLTVGHWIENFLRSKR